MSLAGFLASSAARGSSSIPRKNQTANGIAQRIPSTPNGRNALWPGSGAMLNSLSTLNSPEKAAIREKITMIAREIIATTIANLNATLDPVAFKAMKTM